MTCSSSSPASSTSRSAPGRSEIPLARVGPGAIQGELAALERGKRMASVRAVTDAEVLRIPYARGARPALRRAGRRARDHPHRDRPAARDGGDAPPAREAGRARDAGRRPGARAEQPGRRHPALGRGARPRRSPPATSCIRRTRSRSCGPPARAPLDALGRADAVDEIGDAGRRLRDGGRPGRRRLDGRRAAQRLRRARPRRRPARRRPGWRPPRRSRR